MTKEFTTLDDLLNAVLRKLYKLPCRINTSRGATSEIAGAMLTLKNPRARISSTETKGTAFSAIGELFWYLSGQNRLDFIEYYIPKYKNESADGKTIHGAYGPRLFNFRGEVNQVQNVINQLRVNPNSRKAVIQIYDAMDLDGKYKEFPCTCNLQFLLRDGILNMYTSMRSNDAFWGLPHDIFSFTMIQELIARSLNAQIGWYKHAVCSLHLYDNVRDRVQEYIKEGYQSTTQSMPEMPDGEQWEFVKKMLLIEEEIRSGKTWNATNISDLPQYWIEIATLLQIHTYFKDRRIDEVIQLSEKIQDSIYYPYICTRLSKLNQNDRK